MADDEGASPPYSRDVDVLRGRWLWLLTVVLAAVFTLSAWSEGELHSWTDGWWVLANVVPLLLISRNPLAVVLIFAVSYPLWLGSLGLSVPRDGHVLQSLPTLVALYATGAWDRPLWLRAIALVAPIWMLAAAIVGYWDTDTVDLSFVAIVLIVVWALGVVVGDRNAYARDLEQRTRELEAARHALADQAVAAERSRIARELHDVVAHAMSVITVQAGVGGHLISSRPQRAAEALGVIEKTGREALAELRRMLVVLRSTDAERGHEPQPGVGELPHLFESARAAGVHVEFEQRGLRQELPPGLDLAVYRVVQEGLTNVAKHADGAPAIVLLHFDTSQLVVQVSDHGRTTPDAVTPGQGLTGMAERVALYDGLLETASGPDGFRVTATFPIDVATSVTP